MEGGKEGREMEFQQPGCKSGAEAVLSLQPNSSIPIAYHPLFGPHEDLMLLELDQKLLHDVLHQSVTIRGDPDEDAVLCTQSNTYAIKLVGTSNSMLLIPPSEHPVLNGNPENQNEKDNNKLVCVPVLKVASSNMELVEIAPRLDKLKLLLSENPLRYQVSEMEESEGIENMSANIYEWDDLIEKIQASDDELRSALQALSAVEINGYWRIVDEEYMDLILNMLLYNSVMNDWSLRALNEDEVVSALASDGFLRILALHCLRVFGTAVDEKTGKNCLWSLNERQVCLHFARVILRGRKIKMEIFMEEWMRKIPDGMQASFCMLEGEVLTESLGVETWVYAFSVSSLPYAPAERFSVLFRERPKWEWKDLQPYIRDLKVPGLSSEGLLLKYTRKTQVTLDAEPVLCAR